MWSAHTPRVSPHTPQGRLRKHSVPGNALQACMVTLISKVSMIQVWVVPQCCSKLTNVAVPIQGIRLFTWCILASTLIPFAHPDIPIVFPHQFTSLKEALKSVRVHLAPGSRAVVVLYSSTCYNKNSPNICGYCNYA